MDEMKLSNAEILAEHRRARGLMALCDAAGEVAGKTLYRSTLRALEREIGVRGITPDGS
jgi:hypothetical protein